MDIILSELGKFFRSMFSDTRTDAERAADCRQADIAAGQERVRGNLIPA